MQDYKFPVCYYEILGMQTQISKTEKKTRFADCRAMLATRNSLTDLREVLVLPNLRPWIPVT
jgi:hypothetical protein